MDVGACNTITARIADTSVERHLRQSTSRDMQSVTVSEFDSVLTFSDQLLWWTGYQTFDGLWNTKIRRLHRYITLVVFGVAPILPVIYFIQNFSTATSETSAEILPNIIGFTQSVFKMLFLHHSHSNLVKLFESSRQLRSTYSQDEACSVVINKYTRRARSVLRVIRISYLLVLIFQILEPFLNGDYREYGLPYTFHLPFLPVDETGFYLINYVYQIYVGFCMIIFINVLDGLVMLSITEACLQLDVLSQKLGSLGAKLNGNCSVSSDLKLLHNLHLDCLHNINATKELYSKLVLLQFGISSLMLCTFTYRLTKSNDLSEFSAAFSALFALVAQLFTYCMCGQMMTDKVHDLTSMMYDNKWYSLSLRDQKSLILMMSRSQEEVYISAMGFNLSLRNFVSVMKTAYSYYTLMRNMEA